MLRALNYFILRKMQNKHCSLSSAGLPFGEVRLCDAHTGPFSLDTGSPEIVLLKIVLAGGLQCWMHAALRHEAGAGSRTDLPQGHPTLHQHLSRLLYSDRNQRRDRIAKKEFSIKTRKSHPSQCIRWEESLPSPAAHPGPHKVMMQGTVSADICKVTAGL